MPKKYTKAEIGEKELRRDRFSRIKHYKIVNGMVIKINENLIESHEDRKRKLAGKEASYRNGEVATEGAKKSVRKWKDWGMNAYMASHNCGMDYDDVKDIYDEV